MDLSIDNNSFVSYAVLVNNVYAKNIADIRSILHRYNENTVYVFYIKLIIL